MNVYIAGLLAAVGTTLLLACESSQSAIRDVPLDPECGVRELSGNIRGVVLNSNREPAIGVRVRFVMSGDASVVTATDERGRFEIRCVYPANEYQICLGPEGMERCQNVKGPIASATLQVGTAGRSRARGNVGPRNSTQQRMLTTGPKGIATSIAELSGEVPWKAIDRVEVHDQRRYIVEKRWQRLHDSEYSVQFTGRAAKVCGTGSLLVARSKRRMTFAP